METSLPAEAAEGVMRLVAPSDKRASTSRVLVGAAVRQLTREGWKVCGIRPEADSPWHVVAQRGVKWRVVQVLAPATAPRERQMRRLRLGEAAQIPTSLGRMETWLAHVRPGGRLIFSHDSLSGSAWGSDPDAAHLRLRLGLEDGVSDPETLSPF